MVCNNFIKTIKPWGYERLLALTDHYCLKEIFIKSGYRTSLQYHHKKEESIYVVNGTGFLYFGNNKENISRFDIKEGDGWTLKPLQIHRVEAAVDLLYYEASTIELDDVVRVSDDYDRK